MARFGRSCESRFRQNFRKAFDWIGFNRSFLKSASGNLVTLAIDPCFISKAGKKTPGIGYFWSGCASVMKRGLEILGIAAVNADTRQAVFLKAEQTFTEKLRGRKPGCTKGMKDPDSLVGWYLRMIMRNSRQLLEVSKHVTADAYFSKKSWLNQDAHAQRFNAGTLSLSQMTKGSLLTLAWRERVGRSPKIYFHVRLQAVLAFKSQRFQRTFVLRRQGRCVNFKYLTYY